MEKSIMEKIPEKKRKIYNLLYNNLLCDHDGKNNNILNILIIGDEQVENEAFKAVFWCGQYPDTELNITICAEDIDGYKKSLKEEMPDLEKFVNFNGESRVEKPLANVFIKNKEDALKAEYNCGISLDDFDVELKGKCKKIICKNEIAENDKNELERVAENLNFAYAMFGNERANFGKVNEKLKKSNQDICSSCASAIHIKYKLKYCEGKARVKENGETEEGIEVLVNAINASKGNTVKDYEFYKKLYNELVVLEHRRWMAYMVTGGWCKTEIDDFKKYLYQNGCDHRDKNKISGKKYHACLYDCGDEIKDLTKEFNEIYLGKEECTPKKITNLDDVSLYCYKVLCDKTKAIKIDDFSDVKSISEDLYHAIDQMINNVDNSVNVYKKELEKISSHEKHDEIRNDLRLIEERNQKNNFFAIDAQLIDFIPFCLWYRKKYKAVITISNGNVVDDIAIPMLLRAEHSIILLKKKEDYESKIKSFFKEYYGDEKIINPNVNDPKVLKNISAVDDLKSKYEYVIEDKIKTLKNMHGIKDEDIVINIVPHSDPEAVLAAEKFSYPIVSYRQSGIKCYNKKMSDYYRLFDINLTVNEWLKLCKWEVVEDGKEVMPYDIVKNLEKTFWDPAKCECRGSGDGKYRYTIWNKMFECYNNMNNEKNAEGKFVKRWRRGELGEPEGVGQKGLDTEISKFLNKLGEINIIKDLSIYSDARKAEFNVENQKVFDILANKSGTLFKNIVYYKCKYSGIFNDVRTGVDIKVKESDKEKDNEIDVIATKGMRSVFISCKTAFELKKEYIYEIASEAELFGGIPIIAVAQTLNEEIPFVKRAKNWGVSLLDAKIIKNDGYFNSAIKRILNGEIVSPLDNDFKDKERK